MLKEKFEFSKKNLDAQRKIWMLKEKFGINCASAEAQFGTGKDIIMKSAWPPILQACLYGPGP